MIRNYITNPRVEEKKQALIDDMEDIDELDVGEEIPTIKRNRKDHTLVLPESKIYHTEQQQEKSNNCSLSTSDIFKIA